MKEIDPRDDPEWDDWINRRGRFEGIERDTPDRPQIKPGPEIPLRDQTHNRDREGRVIGDGAD
jgi:hypothetical protein